MVGGPGRLYLPRTSAKGERKRPTCGLEFRLKRGLVSFLKKPQERNPTGGRPIGLSPIIQINLRIPLSPSGTLAFHSVILHTIPTVDAVAPTADMQE